MPSVAQPATSSPAMAAIPTTSVTIVTTITTTIIATTIQMQTTHDATIDRAASLSKARYDCLSESQETFSRSHEAIPASKTIRDLRVRPDQRHLGLFDYADITGMPDEEHAVLGV